MKNLIPAVASAFILTVALPNFAAADAVRSLTLEDRNTIDGSKHEAAAAKGDARSQTALGLKFAAHRTPEADVTAFGWLQRAADQGDAEAQILLSGMFATGRGTDKNIIAAYQWAYLSGLRASEPEIIVNASNMIGVLNRQMSDAEIDQAKQQAADWKPKLEIVQTAAVQSVAYQAASQQPAPAKVETPAPAKPEQAKVEQTAVGGNAETKIAETKTVETKVAAAAPVAEPLAKAEPAPARAKPAADGRRSNTKRAAAPAQPRPRQARVHHDYDAMVSTAISYARAYGIHLGGWQY